MQKNSQLNADRFLGFADVYDKARPKCPEKVKEIIIKYLGNTPSLVVDMGCGTGLSTTIWSKESSKIIGIEPSADMLKIAKENSSGLDNITFISSFSDNTGLDNGCADVITCSQSFHWMNPEATINEVARILKKGGVFAVYDYDWPPVCNWEAELEYNKLSEKVKDIESSHPDLKDSFVRWDKNEHLANITNSGKFRYVREIVFSNSENCHAQRLIGLALSRGGLQAILKANISEVKPYLTDFEKRILDIYGNTEFKIDFGYRMRMGIK
ncbi:Methylase involved in ubiquinone/menaquinone biosynthesis [Candidatus Desulfosporosinus infrequens]|uniref:Methylase involved in ubiquinone/menaquinone biosynthesis n=1 Tax=Candidatus Desulfosporosinus infrequens TaxID=2043169 RepID=A0A2U3LL80_9FIRM|nr:Methylase involved in ubiquinone/menaquinone biosynthesis [Candidatus Desulfosporosinus infrequens]